MGIMDNAKNAMDSAKGAVDKIDPGMIDKAEEVLEEHGDKIPGGLGDKAADALDKVKDMKGE